jgi:hypothetical protein
MAKYLSHIQNSLSKLCFNDENKNFLQNYDKSLSFIQISDEDFNKIKYDSHLFTINNNSLIMGDYLFENDDSNIEQGKPNWITPKEIQQDLNKLIKHISYTIENNKSNDPHPSEWTSILLDLKNLDLSSITQPLRATNFVNAIEKSLPNIVIRGYKEI